jgi:hypothetical protein
MLLTRSFVHTYSELLLVSKKKSRVHLVLNKIVNYFTLPYYVFNVTRI